MLNDFHNRAVLVTGGTMGIGLACGLCFGRQGARVYLTHRWGSADEDEVRRQFAEAGAPEPVIIEADASHEADTQALMARIRQDHEELFVFVSNVTVVQPTQGYKSYTRRALFKSLEYSAWPLVGYVQEARAVFGRCPRYVIGISTDGMATYYAGYENVAIAKSVMEVLGRYMAAHLADDRLDPEDETSERENRENIKKNNKNERVNINMVRTRNVLTQSSLQMHGADYPAFMQRFGGQCHVVRAEEVGNAVLALCSGLLDALNGQIITVDHGGAFSDNMMRIWHHREEYGL